MKVFLKRACAIGVAAIALVGTQGAAATFNASNLTIAPLPDVAGSSVSASLTVAAIPGTETTVANAVANPFDIQVNFVGGLTASQQAVFSDAEAFWETMITGNRYDLNLAPLVIDAEGAAIDGVGGTLGFAGPNTAQITSGLPQNFAYALSGAMTFDSADLADMEASNTLFDVIVHEMGHVIGFGTLWNTDSFGGAFAGTQNVYTDGTGEYTGAYAVTAYNAEFGLTETFVPVELDGGAGTADGHWDENDFAGGVRDLMTGYINSVSPDADAPFTTMTLSATTIASFADIGYTTIVTDAPMMAAVPLPAGIVLSLSALIGLGAASRRRKRG